MVNGYLPTDNACLYAAETTEPGSQTTDGLLCRVRQPVCDAKSAKMVATHRTATPNPSELYPSATTTSAKAPRSSTTKKGKKGKITGSHAFSDEISADADWNNLLACEDKSILSKAGLCVRLTVTGHKALRFSQSFASGRCEQERPLLRLNMTRPT